jgi:hypothetical protein
MPLPVEQDGVRVEVKGLLGTTTRPRGVSGTVQNLGAEQVRSVRVLLIGYGTQGQEARRAETEVRDLPPGAVAKFKARFQLPTPSGVERIDLTKVHVVR